MTVMQIFDHLLQQHLPSAWATEQQQQQLADYLELLKKWNRSYNLTAIDQPLKMVTHHLLDSLAIADWVTARRVLDLGCGAGLPGIPLAIVKPRQSFVLLDSVGKKTRFCQQAKMALGLSNVEVVQARAENWQVEEGFDMIVTRAFSAIDQMLTVAEHLLSEKGVFLAMKGKCNQQEWQSLPAHWSVESQALDVPGLTEQRHVLLIRRC